MKIVFWGNGERGVKCLEAVLAEGFTVPLVVGHNESTQSARLFHAAAERHGLKFIAPPDPNELRVATLLQETGAEVFVLAGYGKIIKRNIIDCPSRMCINLHGGKLPEYRGSSPLNWVLINGEESFTISVIQVDAGVDTGDILAEKTFPVALTDTIRDLHATANYEFPLLLVDVLKKLDAKKLVHKKQDNKHARYFPLRFPEDGLINWEVHTALQVHNRIRALTDPYPGAFSFFQGEKCKLLGSELVEYDYRGEPGRVYKKLPDGILVCAADRCLKITQGLLVDTHRGLFEVAKRYDRFATSSSLLLAHFEGTESKAGVKK